MPKTGNCSAPPFPDADTLKRKVIFKKDFLAELHGLQDLVEGVRTEPTTFLILVLGLPVEAGLAPAPEHL